MKGGIIKQINMEKILITKCEPIMNGAAHGVTLADGRQCTAWNDKIDAGLLMQLYASGKPALMEIKPYFSKTGKQGHNIVAIGQDTEVTTTQPTPSIPMENAPMFSKDKSIIAQCMVKGAVELAKDLKLTNNDELGEYLNMAVVELVGAYKQALIQLELE